MSKIIIILSILYFACATNLFAQKTGILKGKVVDSISKAPLQFATVALINKTDSSLISYTISDDSGSFTLRNINVGTNVRLLISFASFQTYRIDIKLTSTQTLDMGQILLSPKVLAEVKIVGERPPVVVKADTIEFNAEAFKTKPNAVVEELLKKLPGIQIDNNGTIYVTGKRVTKLLVDGKRFFSDDPKIASKNLDAELIDKVQVYDDRETDPDHLISETDVNKIINLKFKKKFKKSLFGKIYAGAGTNEAYETGGLVNAFRDTLQVSLIGLSNNINKSAFSFGDLNSLGGFQRGGSRALSNGNLLTGGNIFTGIQKILSSGFNINTDYGKKLKINLNYFYSYGNSLNASRTLQQQFLADTMLINNSRSNTDNRSHQNGLNAFVQWNPNSKTQVRYTSTLSVSRSTELEYSAYSRSNNFIPYLSFETDSDKTNNRKFAYQHNLFFYKVLNAKGNTLTINQNFSVSPGKSDQFYNTNLTSFLTVPPKVQLTDKQMLNEDSKTATDISINYRHPVTKKLTTNVIYLLGLSNTGQVNTIFDIDPLTNAYIFLTDQSIDMQRKQLTNKLSSEWTYRPSKVVSVIAGINLQSENFWDHFRQNSTTELDRNYFYLLPYMRLQLKHWSFSYESSISNPRLSDLQPVSIVYNPLYTFTGNPNLKPTSSQSINASFSNFLTDKMITYSANSNFSYQGDKIIRMTNVSSTGATVVTPVNLSGADAFTGFLNGYVNKRFRKIGNYEFNSTTSFNTGFYKNIFFVNHIVGLQYLKNWGITQQVTMNYNNKFDMSAQYTIRLSNSDYKNVPYNDVSYNTQSLNTKASYFFTKTAFANIDYTYSFNSQVDPAFQRSFNLLNVSLSKLVLKQQKGEIKLSVFDLLNKNVSTARIAADNSIYDAQNEVLRRYFLLSFLFKFNTAKH